VSRERWVHTAHHLLPIEYTVTKSEKETPVRETSLFLQDIMTPAIRLFSRNAMCENQAPRME